MALSFHVLASGSSGNAALLEADGRGILIDCGVAPRLLARRLRACGRSWRRVQAVVLSHTHGDHWRSATLRELWRRQIPLYCHPAHATVLERARAFMLLENAGLVRHFSLGSAWEPAPGCRCEAFEVSHDCELTCGFRFEGTPTLFGPSWAVGYAADLGCWDERLAQRLVDVDVLALEFNHDVVLQRQSQRPDVLIRRVLGDRGHLSNVQAAELLRAVVLLSEPGRLQHLVQIHLSQECNRPELACAVAREALYELGVHCHIHSASADEAGPSLPPRSPAYRRRTRRQPLHEGLFAGA
jgi:phosphoribosyl 1,2-cyclic phosphodiesterase